MLAKVIQPMLPPILESVSITRRPIFPGYHKTIHMQNSVFKTLCDRQKNTNPLIGAFLTSSQSKIPVINEFLDDIYKVGVFCKVIGTVPIYSGVPEIDSDTAVVVLPLRRIKSFEYVEKITNSIASLKVEEFLDLPYDCNSLVIKALIQEIFQTISELSKLSIFFREHLANRIISSSTFEDPAKICDLVAVLCSGESSELQEILEANDIETRLAKALELLKKEVVIARLQESIVKDVETKIQKNQREMFLKDQLKVIQRELGLDIDPREKIVQQFKERIAEKKLPEIIKNSFDEVINILT